ncbi:5-formyltetrahydrofolate cyclo-ligase [Paenibacillus mucilaginosus]|uniref:5-formyltetrahydrofolate cyclo-ligase n=3 Tax=Paenibacillus mucilaginosus TaxID=61624 RepID=H6NSV7_9BACL|nr:5-formyltetrahydrofolate cyclo-ligase [Paenibacillus mucilaginosus]AEI39211.1 5-formyltetrahydrofolate cyclo-ligase family protein [Paenibacillus mucilaginosus KNP414]AFC27498.1 5-formyltetrahydrofolate cyclo-ligase [Paenibacillus mucilaginosus 3016]AFH59652.1 5-formyltetrahydrofolate cyclo-ligase [Paenibacillus mucilaginosus K02]MCG7217146.1 5-formyltetrahydrofolate cyclo-ligase [Paenibacillus mucilaginosus]WDM28221.1 5-formyltetrahydrofolate cyclo-ligase [Paenibacillus mucilaginosus]
MNIKERKIELRRQAEAIRSALTEEQRKEKSAVISAKVIERLEELLQPDPSVRRRPTLFTYMPVKTEVDVTPVLEACWKRHWRVVVPKVFAAHKQLKLYEVRSYADLERGTWGIREPVAKAQQLMDIRQIDVALVPGLAFDLSMGRLGYGGGFYDRFMQQYVRTGLPKPYIIAASFDEQLIPEVPMGLFDFRINELITETRTIVEGSGKNDG